MENNRKNKIAVLIPCYNEEITIGKVIDDFRHELPEAAIYVFDNNSTDRSVETAQEHNVQLVKEHRQGKGFVVENMFNVVDADYYVMVDGDDTYPAEYVHELLKPLQNGQCDMVVGARLTDHAEKSFNSLHYWGNKLVCWLINRINRAHLTDIMSGYRAFTRRVVDRLPVISEGFEIETEMTIQMLYWHLDISEINIPYRRRPEGSQSKLRTFRDGFKVIWKIFSLFRAFKPLTFFGGIGIIILLSGISAGIPPIHDYMTDPQHRVLHLPMAILATGLVLLGAGFGFLGVLLHVLNWRFREIHNIITRRQTSRH